MLKKIEDKKLFSICILVGVTIFMLDQVSKYWILANLSHQSVIELMPSLNFVLAHNHGAAFGFLAKFGGWQRIFLAGIATTVCFVILVWLAKLKRNNNKLEAVSLALVFGGALGNLLDRIRYGYVVDFIDFYIKDWHWYTFNVADIAICIGVFFLILVSIRS